MLKIIFVTVSSDFFILEIYTESTTLKDRFKLFFNLLFKLLIVKFKIRHTKIHIKSNFCNSFF